MATLARTTLEYLHRNIDQYFCRHIPAPQRTTLEIVCCKENASHSITSLHHHHFVILGKCNVFLCVQKFQGSTKALALKNKLLICQNNSNYTSHWWSRSCLVLALGSHLEAQGCSKDSPKCFRQCKDDSATILRGTGVVHCDTAVALSRTAG